MMNTGMTLKREVVKQPADLHFKTFPLRYPASSSKEGKMKRDLRLIQMGVLLIMAMAMVTRVTAMPPDSFKHLFISGLCDQESDSPNCASDIEECMTLLQFNPGEENVAPPDPSIICADRPLFECIEKISNCTTLISAGVSKLPGALGIPGGPSGPGGFGFPGGPSGPGDLGIPGGPSGPGGFGFPGEPSGSDGSGHGGFGSTEESSGSDGSGHGGFGATEEPSGPGGSGHGGFGATEEPSGPDGSGHGGFGSAGGLNESSGSGHGGFGATEDPSGPDGSGHGGFGSAGGPSDSGGSEGSVIPDNSLPTKEMIQGICATRDTPNCVEQVQQCFELIGPGGSISRPGGSISRPKGSIPKPGGSISSGGTKEPQECVGENCAKCTKMIEPTPKFLSAAQSCYLKVSASLSLKECMKPTMEDHVRSAFPSDTRQKLLKYLERCYQNFDFEGIRVCMITSCASII